MQLLDISQNISTAYHPQTDGQTERVNQVLEHFLRTFCSWDQKDWVELLPYAEFCYNNTVYFSHKITLFYANFGYNPGDNYPAEVIESNVPAAEKYILKLDKLRKDTRDTLVLAKGRIAKYYNKNIASQEPKFRVGNKVMLNRKNIKTIRPIKKLDHKIHGPFKVKRLIGPYAYELDIPAFVGRPHLVYHTSLLEPYYRNEITARRSRTPPTSLD